MTLSSMRMGQKKRLSAGATTWRTKSSFLSRLGAFTLALAWARTCWSPTRKPSIAGSGRPVSQPGHVRLQSEAGHLPLQKCSGRPRETHRTAGFLSAVLFFERATPGGWGYDERIPNHTSMPTRALPGRVGPQQVALGPRRNSMAIVFIARLPGSKRTSTYHRR